MEKQDSANKVESESLQESCQDLFADRYILLEELGKGGMGIVYKAKQLHLQKLYAIKMLRSVNASAEALQRFDREAKAISKLDHENLITAHDLGLSANNEPYIVMDFVEGEGLADSIARRGPLPVDDALKIFISICRGMAYAHAKGVLHRDLKPSNIMLVPGSTGDPLVKIIDFGIAKLIATDHDVHLTKTGDVVGSPLYMSPEQAKGQAPDERSDVYSMGVLMYETLSGQVPFRGANSLEVLYRHINDEAPPLMVRGRQLPVALVAIVETALAKDPEQRYQSMQALQERLEAAQKMLSSPAARALAFFGGATEGKTSGKTLAVISSILIVVCFIPLVVWHASVLKSPPKAVELMNAPVEEQARYSEEADPLAQTLIEQATKDRSGRIELGDHKITDRDLKGFWPLDPNVYRICLANNPVSSNGIRILLGQKIPPALTELDLAGTEVDDTAMERIARIKTLKSICVNRTKVTDQGIALLSTLPLLEVLYTDNNSVTNAAIPYITKIRGLRQLSLVGDKVDDDGIAQLNNGLFERLFLGGTKISDHGLSHVAKNCNPRELSLHDTNVSDAGIALIGNMSSLRVLDLAHSKISDKGLQTLAGLELENLNLGGTKITDRGLTQLARCLFLRDLNLESCPKLTRPALENLQKKLRHCHIYF